MKHAYRAVIAIWSISTFILVLFISLIPMIFNHSFYQNIWEKNHVYEDMNISEQELTKVIDHTMDYMWGREDSLQVQVTLNDGTVRDFYVVWDEETDELKHMEDCRALFLAGKSLATISFIVWVMATGALILEKDGMDAKMINVSYITYGAIVLLVGIFTVIVLVNFDAAFVKFHEIFFPQGNWQFPSYSFMIRMLPEDALFASIVYKALIHFFSFFAIVIAGTILIQKKAFKKPNQISIDQQS